VAGIAALWQERRTANAHDPDYSLSVSAPTNRDAREVAAAMRQYRRAAGELGADRVVLSACDQTGDAYDLPLAVGDRVRLFARTNAVYADRSRGSLGHNGSVLEVRAIGPEGVTLRNAGGREGLVAWDTLRDPRSGRIRLSYGDVLTIDATQGLTSTEHIEAMPAGTQGVNAYKAYTAASRHRRATFLVVSDGAERREIAGRRPLGDPRPIQEGDVWANMGRNLSRQPEPDSALAFLERAHQVRRDAVAALQSGLQRIEQRQADGLEPTTLAQHLQRGRIVAQLGPMTEQLAAWTQQQGALLDGLARLGPALQEAISRAIERLGPEIRAAAERIRQRPERVLQRQREAELQAAQEADRERLLASHMQAWRRGTRQGRGFLTPALEAQWQAEATAEETRRRREIASMPAQEIRQALQREEAERVEQQQAAARFKGPSPGM
jgi:hypothetical protein